VIVRGRFPVPRGGRRSPRPALPIAWVVLALTAAACGEGAPPPPELPGFETPRGPTELTVALDVTFTQGEAPIQVPRTVVIPLGDDLQGNEAFLLEAALEALVAGPTPDEEARGITSFFSEATADLVAEVTLEGDSAMVDFRDVRTLLPNASSSTGSFLFLSELNGTVFGLPGIERVEYRMEGSCEDFWNFLQRSCQEVRRPLDT
jgi:hypothetical protein